MYLQVTPPAFLPGNLRPSILWFLDDVSIYFDKISSHLKENFSLFDFRTTYYTKMQLKNAPCVPQLSVGVDESFRLTTSISALEKSTGLRTYPLLRWNEPNNNSFV